MRHQRVILSRNVEGCLCQVSAPTYCNTRLWVDLCYPPNLLTKPLPRRLNKHNKDQEIKNWINKKDRWVRYHCNCCIFNCNVSVNCSKSYLVIVVVQLSFEILQFVVVADTTDALRKSILQSKNSKLTHEKTDEHKHKDFTWFGASTSTGKSR